MSGNFPRPSLGAFGVLERRKQPPDSCADRYYFLGAARATQQDPAFCFYTVTCEKNNLEFSALRLVHGHHLVQNKSHAKTGRPAGVEEN